MRNTNTYLSFLYAKKTLSQTGLMLQDQKCACTIQFKTDLASLSQAVSRHH